MTDLAPNTVLAEPRFAMPAGTQLRFNNNDFVVNERNAEGVFVTAISTGEPNFMSHSQVHAAFKAGRFRISGVNAEIERQKAGLSGHASLESLNNLHRNVADFKVMLARGLQAYREIERQKKGQPDFDFTVRSLEQAKTRKSFLQYINATRDKNAAVAEPRGGADRSRASLYCGRVLFQLLQTADNLPPGASLRSALCPKFFRRGQRGDRLDPDLRALMDQALEEVGMKPTKTSNAEIHRRLRDLVIEENLGRVVAGLPKLEVPAAKTLIRHRKERVAALAWKLSREGDLYARNNYAPGQSDLRALKIGEVVHVDECTLSLVNRAQETGLWANMGSERQSQLERADQELRGRFILLFMKDVATDMPLGWIVSDRTGAEPTIELLRMALSNRQRAKNLYQCSTDPVPEIGIGEMVIDNGTGLRNIAVIEAANACGISVKVARIAAAPEKFAVERAFGTLESELIKALPGYTGRRPGELTGYKPVENGILSIGMLNEIITRYWIDIYPRTQRRKVGVGNYVPLRLYSERMHEYGCLPPIDPNERRIALGWRYEVTPSKVGIRVLSGIFYNSPELQVLKDRLHGLSRKVKVFIDPMDLTVATVVLPGIPDPIEVPLSTTYFAGMTIHEALALVARYIFENPADESLNVELMTEARVRNWHQIREEERRHTRKTSFPTREACERRAAELYQGLLPETTLHIAGTGTPGALMSIGEDAAALPIGGGTLIEGQVAKVAPRSARTGTGRKVSAHVIDLENPKNVKDLE